MRLQTLVSAVNADVNAIADQMNLQSDAIIINQCNQFGYQQYDRIYEKKPYNIKCYSFAEKGVGLSRNSALLRADADILLFSDEDIVYEDGYAKKVLKAFEEHPDADMLLFNMKVGETRATYHTEQFHRVHVYNAGRYPTYSFAIRREKLHAANITFSLLFGGGAPFSNGEDSLFLKECIEKGFRVFAVPVNLGSETERQSTWFNGYHEKFFYDRGVLYHYLYRSLAVPMAIRFLFAHKNIMCHDIPVKQAYQIMKKGIRSQKG